MKKKIILFIITALLLQTLLCGCQSVQTGLKAGENAVLVTDCLGRKVAIPENANRFVAIGPGALRLYCYVGDTSKLVGIEAIETSWGQKGRPYVQAHEELLQLDVIGEGGPGVAPDPEKLIAADPDVIFTMYNSDVGTVDALQEKTGIPVAALSYGVSEVFDEGMYKSLEVIAEITGEKERLNEVMGYFSEWYRDLQKRTSDISDEDRPTVYLGAQSYRGTTGIESTTGNYSLFNVLNTRSVVDQAGISTYAVLDKEKLLDMDPDIIIIDAGGLANLQLDYLNNPEYYKELSAVRRGSIYMQLPYNYYYTNIDTAVADAYYIGSILYPERFADIDVKKKADEIYIKLLKRQLYDQVASDYYGGFQSLSFDKNGIVGIKIDTTETWTAEDAANSVDSSFEWPEEEMKSIMNLNNISLPQTAKITKIDKQTTNTSTTYDITFTGASYAEFDALIQSVYDEGVKYSVKEDKSTGKYVLIEAALEELYGGHQWAAWFQGNMKYNNGIVSIDSVFYNWDSYEITFKIMYSSDGEVLGSAWMKNNG
ncbi:MAG: ABC transporter substrate-binding protein [Oscillospiraceae bacterium]|jgi:iron complex transport system substrate-binding protein